MDTQDLGNTNARGIQEVIDVSKYFFIYDQKQRK